MVLEFNNLLWVESLGMVSMVDSLIHVKLGLFCDPYEVLIGRLTFDPEDIGNVGDEDILRSSVWMGLGGGVGGESLFPPLSGEWVFMLY